MIFTKKIKEFELQNTKKHVVGKYTRAHFFHDFCDFPENW